MLTEQVGAPTSFRLGEPAADRVFPSANAYGIPDLDPTMQASGLDAPLTIWGAQRRGRVVGTVAFYTDDYRFSSVWSRPEQIVDSGATGAVEGNFSVVDSAPMAVRIWNAYRKRWLARYWQSQGLRLWVDLCGAREPVDLMGVPAGWRAFATRGFEDRVEDLDSEWALAASYHEAPIVLVYGGGARVRAWCFGRSVIHVPHILSAKLRPGQGTRAKARRESE